MQSPSKFKYLIYPDHTYTLVYGDTSIEVSGRDILNMFEGMAKEVDNEIISVYEYHFPGNNLE